MKWATPPPNKSSASKPNQSIGPSDPQSGSLALSWNTPYLKVSRDRSESVMRPGGLAYLATPNSVYLLSSHEIRQYFSGSSSLNRSPPSPVGSRTQQ